MPSSPCQVRRRLPSMVKHQPPHHPTRRGQGGTQVGAGAGVEPAVGAHPALAADAGALDKELYCRSSAVRALSAEFNSMKESCRQAKELGLDLGDRPLVVLTADELADPANELPAKMAAHYPEMRKVWLELQQELVGLSTNVVHEVVPRAGHYVHHDRPEVVILHVRSMIESFR